MQILKALPVQNFLALVCSLYLRVTHRLTTWEKLGFEIPESYVRANKPFVTCFWHARLMMLPFAWSPPSLNPRSFHMLISKHADGKLISKTVSYFGIQTIEGSTKHDGNMALKKMIRILKNKGTVGITPDGPKGPRERVKMGTVMASYLSKADILPVTFSVSSSKIFKSWDRFLWAFPSKSGVLIWGKPISAPLNPEAFEHVRLEVETELTRLTALADQIVQKSKGIK